MATKIKMWEFTADGKLRGVVPNYVHNPKCDPLEVVSWQYGEKTVQGAWPGYACRPQL
jgi:hypothetical protein